MILDKNVDSNLWLMLKADKSNRETIVDFIIGIPFALRDTISKDINFLNTLTDEERRRYHFVFGKHETKDCVLYWYEINSVDNILRMGYKVLIDDKYIDFLEVNISINDNLIKNYVLGDNFIGSVQYDIGDNISDNLGISGSSDKKYYLIRTSFGYFINYYNNDNLVFKHYLKPINTKDIPEELSIEEMQSKKIHKLVKKKRI